MPPHLQYSRKHHFLFIHGINGRTVTVAQSADGSTEIDMSGFAPGIYIVTATTANDRKTRKIIL